MHFHCSLLRLIVRSWLDVPTFATRRLHACYHATAPSLNADLHVTFRDLRHGTDGFTSPPKEGVLRIFSPRTWVPKASTLPLDHLSRWFNVFLSASVLDASVYFTGLCKENC